MDITQIEAAMIAAHNPELEKQGGGVIQMWEDGEITYQKSGDLLWARTLHCFKGGLEDVKMDLPMKYGEGHSYVCLTQEQADEFYRRLREVLNKGLVRFKDLPDGTELNYGPSIVRKIGEVDDPTGGLFNIIYITDGLRIGGSGPVKGDRGYIDRDSLMMTQATYRVA